jgi:F-type H+-transporting ATPase subunit delta
MSKSNQQIDVGRQRVAQVYAKALIEAAEASGQTDAVVEQLDSLVDDVLDQHADLETLFASALVSEEEKISILDRIFGAQALPLVLNFLKVLARRERLDCVRAVQQQARKIYNEMRGHVAVQVRTAAPIDSNSERLITEGVKEELGLTAQLETTTEPELIGGVVLRIGDKVFDGSVATQLRRTRGEMIRRSIHEIQSGRDRFSYPEGN